MVVAAAAPDASSRDRSLLGFELPTDMSRARLAGALTSAGLAPGLDHPAPRPVRADRARADRRGRLCRRRRSPIGQSRRSAPAGGAGRLCGAGGGRMSGPQPRAEVLQIAAVRRRRIEPARRQPRHETVVQRGRVRAAAGARRPPLPASPQSCTATRTAARRSCAARSARGSGSTRRKSSAAPARTN